jgi:hypothetical protein
MSVANPLSTVCGWRPRPLVSKPGKAVSGAKTAMEGPPAIAMVATTLLAKHADGDEGFLGA